MTTTHRRFCVYCGSSEGNRSAYRHAAIDLGACLVSRGLELVYGGASIGLMGAVADATLAAGGKVHGVMPEKLADLEISHSGLTELHITASMHERKTRMADLSDGFIALPGGLGTLEELFEIWTWSQLGFHNAPIGLLNIEGYFDPLINFLDQSVSAGFVKPGHRQMLIIDEHPEQLVDRMLRYEIDAPPKIGPR